MELLEAIHSRLRRRRTIDRAAEDAARASLPPATPAPVSPRLGARVEQRLVFDDPTMQALFQQVDRIAVATISVLVLGETGVGKEIIAEHIHRRAGRKGRFLALNCAALSENLLESELFGHEKGAFTGAVGSKEGLFESADGGTVFLDEVGELPPSPSEAAPHAGGSQGHARRRTYGTRDDVRFVSATHRDIEAETSTNEGFRQDLYFRLSGITLQVPPLRERRADIAPLVRAFAAASSRTLGRSVVPEPSVDALQRLERYDWPANIRELRNVVERAVILCDGATIERVHLPPRLVELERRPSPATPTLIDPRAKLLGELERLDRERIVEALARCGGNQTHAAELLGISRRTLTTRMHTYDLPRPRKRA